MIRLAAVLFTFCALAAPADEVVWPIKPPPDVPYYDFPHPDVHLWALEGPLQKARSQPVDLLIDGDWYVLYWSHIISASDPLRPSYKKYNPVVFGADEQVQNLVWRLQHGELTGLQPKLIVLEIGTENLDQKQKPEDVAAGIKMAVDLYRKDCPDAHIVLMGVFPDSRDFRNIDPQSLEQTNKLIAHLADRDHVTFLDLTAKIMSPDGKIDIDKYQETLTNVWEDALQPLLDQYLPDSALSDPKPLATPIQSDEPQLSYPYSRTPPPGVPPALFPVPGETGLHEFDDICAQLKAKKYDVILDGGGMPVGQDLMSLFGKFNAVSLDDDAFWGTGVVTWRLQHDELKNQDPKLVVLKVGTVTFSDINHCVKELKEMVADYEKACPNAHIILIGPLPRENDPELQGNLAAAAGLAKESFDSRVTYVDLTADFMNPDGTPKAGYWEFSGSLTAEGLKVWATEVMPLVQQHGAPAK